MADFGRNIGFEGGLSLWEKEYALSVIFEEKAKQIAVGANNSEIYFECSDIEAFFERLTKGQVRVIHPVMEHPWGQRAFRVYDPDNHILEFAEPMSEVVLRLHHEGLGVEAIAAKSMMPPEFIKNILHIKEHWFGVLAPAVAPLWRKTLQNTFRFFAASCKGRGGFRATAIRPILMRRAKNTSQLLLEQQSSANPQ